MKKVKTNHAISFLLVIVVFISFAFFLSLTPRSKIEAQTNPVPGTVLGTAVFQNLKDEGYTVEGYTLYFLESDSGVSGTGVTYNTSTGTMSGSAWSPSYGTVNFSSAIINITTGVMTGVATTPSFTTNSSVNNDTETTIQTVNGVPTVVPTDWATGNISLNNTGVTFDLTTGHTNATHHWAWGGNVIGWVDFSGVSIVPVPITPPTCTIIPPSSAINPGESLALSWSGTNLTANSCTASNGSGSWAGANKPISGVFDATPTITTTYNMSCLGSDGITSSPTCSATVTVDNLCHNSFATNYGQSLPCIVPGGEIDLKVDKKKVNPDDLINLTWDLHGQTGCYTSSISSSVSGTNELWNAFNFITDIFSISLTDTTQFTITCPGGSTKSVCVIVTGSPIPAGASCKIPPVIIET